VAVFSLFSLIGGIVLGALWLFGAQLSSPWGEQVSSTFLEGFALIKHVMTAGPKMATVVLHPGTISPGILFYSMFFPSVWVWLYLLASLVVIAANRVQHGISFLRWLLDIEKHPLRVIAVVAGAIAVIGSWIVLLVAYSFGMLIAKN
jgi:hypothetical protein